jgi:glycosyltransferase involved in cell wall biosynthesis
LQDKEKIVVCIPAYDEERSIAKVILKARKYTDSIIVCDDGSGDMTGEISRALGVTVIRHERNLGKGEALRSLIERAKTLVPTAVVTIDADGQFDSDDIPKVSAPILNAEADIVIGVREMRSGTVPRERIVGNKVLDAITSAKAGEGLHDTQSGFRAYSAKALDKIDFTQRGMAIESQTLIDATSVGLRIKEVLISVKYQGIPAKRNPLRHLSEVVDYLLTRTIVDSPLLYLGLPGLVALVIGVVAGVRVLSIFAATRVIAIGTALISVMLVVVGAVMVATSVILKFIRAQVRG